MTQSGDLFGIPQVQPKQLVSEEGTIYLDTAVCPCCLVYRRAINLRYHVRISCLLTGSWGHDSSGSSLTLATNSRDAPLLVLICSARRNIVLFTPKLWYGVSLPANVSLESLG